jgi:hypothetical protein
MSQASEPKPREWGWTLSQRRGLLVLLTLFLSFLIVQAVRNRTFISDPQPSEGPRAAELQSRIDPNSADWQTLAAIPNLGEKRAKAIVAYRDGMHIGHAKMVVFHSPADLLHIRGIGAATVENLRPYLSFPSDEPRTRE